MLLLIKLTSGEELLGDMVAEDSVSCLVDRPLRVIYMPKPISTRNSQIFLHELSPFSDGGTITIPKHHVMYTSKPRKEVNEYYKEMLQQLDSTDEVPMNDIQQDETLSEGEKEAIALALLDRMTATSNTTLH